ncbi:MAG: hypothetical protein R3F55_02555 [Alphaproteobacteria bacterium]
MTSKLSTAMLAGIAITLAAGPAAALDDAPPPGWRAAVDTHILPDIARIVGEPIVGFTVTAQNGRFAGIGQDTIDALDGQWRAEREAGEQPLISAVLSNPASSYLTRVQAQSIGLYSEIFIMDDHGLNVGQSNVSSDFWQGDEAKWQETFARGAGSVFVDEPEFRDDIGVWVVQVNVSVDRDDAAIGAATFEVNLTELVRRTAAAAS